MDKFKLFLIGLLPAFLFINFYKQRANTNEFICRLSGSNKRYTYWNGFRLDFIKGAWIMFDSKREVK